MHVLVTGGAGFIGSHVVDQLLARNHTVDVVDNLSTGSLDNLASARRHDSALHVKVIDVRDPELVTFIARRRPEIVFHLAAQASVAVSLERPQLDAEVNVLGSLHVLEGACAGGSRKVVYAASGGTLYGDVPAAYLPLTEDNPRRPTSPYGMSKAVVLDYLEFYREVLGLDFTALALANVYGPRQSAHGEAGVVAIFSANFAEAKASTIFGNGKQTRDFVYVTDVADAFVRAIDRGTGRILNIGTGVQTSVNVLYEMLAAASRSDLRPILAPARAGEVFASALDPGRAISILGWSPRVSMSEGCEQVLAAMGELTAVHS